VTAFRPSAFVITSARSEGNSKWNLNVLRELHPSNDFTFCGWCLGELPSC